MASCTLIFLAKVSEKVCIDLWADYNSAYFVDYSPCHVKIPGWSKIRVLSVNGVPVQDCFIALYRAFDQFGNQLFDGIPEGWKTVVNIAFKEPIAAFAGLSEQDGFTSNPFAVKLEIELPG